MGKLYTVGTAGEPYIAGEVCGSGQAVGVWASLASSLTAYSLLTTTQLANSHFSSLPSTPCFPFVDHISLVVIHRGNPPITPSKALWAVFTDGWFVAINNDKPVTFGQLNKDVPGSEARPIH